MTAAALMAVSVLLVGCSDAEEAGPSPTTTALPPSTTSIGTSVGTSTTAPLEPPVPDRPELPPGFRLIDGAPAGYAVAVPEPWRDFPLGAADVDRLIREAAAANPAVAGLLDAQARALLQQGGKLFALNPDDDGRTNLNLLQIPLTRPLEQEVDGVVAQLQAAGGREFRRDTVTIPAGEAVRLQYQVPVNLQDGSSLVLEQQQYYVQKDQSAYVLTLVTDDLGAQGQALSHIAESFQLLS